MVLPQEHDKTYSVPPKTAFMYQDLEPRAETASYRTFEAETRISLQEKHLIRILNPTKDFDSAATLFIQELFHLENRCPGTVLIGTLEICTERKQVACATRQHGLMNIQPDQIQESVHRKDPKMIEKLISDVLSDVEFLRSELLMKDVACLIEPENIFHLGEFYLTHWDKILQQREETTTISVGSKLTSQDLVAEIRALAFVLLQMMNAETEELKLLLSSKVRESTYKSAVEASAKEGFGDLPKIQNLIERMLSYHPQNLPSLEELHIKEAAIQNSSLLCPQCKKKKNKEAAIQNSSLLCPQCKKKKNKIVIIGNLNFMIYILFY